MKPAADLLDISQRVRRNTRSADIIELCDAIEVLLVKKPKPSSQAKRDRAEYMRNWRKGEASRIESEIREGMRKLWAAEKEKKA